MSKIEILSLVVTIVCLVSFCLVFTFLFRHYYKSNIDEIKEGRADLDLIEYNKEEEISKKKNEKKSKIYKVIGKTGSYLVLAIVVTFFGFSLYSRVFNNNLIFGDSGFVVIASGSMSYKNEANTYLFTYDLNNQFDTYDIIGITKYKSIEDVKLYDVVAYHSTDGTIIVHRIREINSNDTFVTRGDANFSDDTGTYYQGSLKFDDIIGYYNGNRTPLIGVFIIFLQSNSGIITIVSIVYCLLMFDHYKAKYEEAIYDRIEYLDKHLNFDYYKEGDINELIKSRYDEYIYYGNKEFKFTSGAFISSSDISKEKIDELIKEKDTFTNEYYSSKQIDTNLISKIKDLFNKNKDEENKSNKEDSDKLASTSDETNKNKKE